ncbi:carcinoembryonic antigen-related cell adhesion molecule 8-like isoform X3 [Tachysurus fulvidraco]|uniref:carcinoembryonic antigen-related cell adhesion molecule 8-like isoform X3 n=1 Tax=Tachysurus fulvidraco TaxID=1234273 RepID=UPI001FEED849|nr:carcinoembryonic antigen-related cell adhesion molecule 8-like isoform X3 [Tachysurus fulvidraco]
MPGGDFFIMMLLLWTFVGRGVDGETVTGVLHERVELRGRYGQNPDVESVEWASYTVNSTKKVLYSVIKAGNVTCFYRCQNISFNLENMSLILDHITKEDEGNYEEKTLFKNKTILYFNITLSVPYLEPKILSVSKVNFFCSSGSLTLICETSGKFKQLQWFKNARSLPDDQRFSLSDNNKTMVLSNLTSSDCGNYTCQVSNANGTSAAHVIVSENACPQESSTVPQQILFSAGLSLICLLVLCISLICLGIYYDRRKIKNASNEEPLYQEPTSFQPEAVTPAVEPLLVVYQDFIKPEDSHQSEDFGYSTIPDVKEKIQPSQSSSSKLPKT